MAIDGEKIAEARRTADLTQQQLAAKAGISQSYLSGIEHGDRVRMRPHLYERLCDALNITDRTQLMTTPPTP